MKNQSHKIITLLVASYFLLISSVLAQAPQKMSYQAVIRNSANLLVVNSTVTMRFSILQGSSTGTGVYVEKHSPTTNINGLVTLEIGGGTVISGTFASINWGAGPYFLKTETDPSGGNNYTIVGVSQLLSVPYALYAANAWAHTGNAGTTNVANFIGTTDNVPMNFRVNNQKAGKVSTNGQVLLGYQAGNGNTAGYITAIGYNALFSNTNGTDNTATGLEALYSNTTGVGNTANGQVALRSNTIGNYNTALGWSTLKANTSGGNNTAIGASVLKSNTIGNENLGAGYVALNENTTGSLNTACGSWALYSNLTGSNNTAIGWRSLYKNVAGEQNVANGMYALRDNTSGNSNTANGYGTLLLNTTGSLNAASGARALSSNITGSNNTALGYSADVSAPNLSNATAIGYNAKVSTSNSLVLGGTGVDAVKVGIGVTAPVAVLDIKGNVKIQDGTEGVGKVLTSDATGLATWATPTGVGGNDWSLNGNANATAASYLGTPSGTLVPLIVKVNGIVSGRIDAGLPANAFWGYNSGSSITTGVGNAALGDESLFFNHKGSYNTAIGVHAMRTTIPTTTAESNGNTGIGAYGLGSNTTGSNNTSLGYNADVSTGNLTNATAIGANTKVSASNSLVLGDVALSTKVGIGTSSPIQKLEIMNGSVLLSNNTTAPGRIALQGSTTGLSTFQAGAQTAGSVFNYTLPIVSPANNQVLTATQVTTSGTTSSTQLEWKSTGNFTHYIGELFGGGIVFYVYRDAIGAEHGLIASLADLAPSVWSSVATTIGISAQRRSDGAANSAAILASNPGGASAAKACINYVAPDGTTGSWYLPSMDELSLLYKAAFIIDKVLPNGNFSNASNCVYWSSTEITDVANSAQNQLFHDGGSYSVTKNSTWNVRAVRAF